MTPTDDVALPELPAHPWANAGEGWDEHEGAAIKQFGIVAILADRARASERSTAEPGLLTEAASIIEDYAEHIKLYDLQAERSPINAIAEAMRAKKDRYLEVAAKLRASPPASDAALEKDAMRYRWLKQADSLMQGAHIAVLTKNGGWVAHGDGCDHAIDSLMQPTATDETGERG